MRFLLAGILVLAGALRLWRLDQNGVGTEYYSAAVRSMLQGWHNVFYNTFDPAGFVSLDKPPVALWLQVASARLAGFNGLALLLPQVLEGVAAVWVLYLIVRRRFGAAAGLLAALFLALTPISVATDRSSNTDSCLVLVLLLAAWALLRAAEYGDRRFLALSMVLVGVGFNVKMLAAFVVLPTFVAVYLLGAPYAWRRRVVDLTLGCAVLAIVSLSWVLAYDLTPHDRRPFVGGTKTNSMLELAVGHNGLERFTRRERPSAQRVDQAGAPPAAAQSPSDSSQPAAAPAGPRRLVLGFGDRVPAGPLRLFHPYLAVQDAWLLPAALAGLILGLVTLRRRTPLTSSSLFLILWLGWAVTYWVVYSLTTGIFHSYYLATIAPAMAALASVGLVGAWSRHGPGPRDAWWVPTVLVLTAVWQLYVQTGALLPDLGGAAPWRIWLVQALMGGTVVAVVALLAGISRRLSACAAHRTALVGLAVGIAALLVLPAAWALSSVLSRGNVMLPSANLNRLALPDGGATLREQVRLVSSTGADRLIDFLHANRHGERYLLATASGPLAAPIIIRTGEAVMAMGGFHGEDPILTPERLGRMVAAGEVRFALLGDRAGFGWRPGGETAGHDVADWIRANGAPVATELWRAREVVARGAAARTGRLQLYDLRPAAGPVRGGATS